MNYSRIVVEAIMVMKRPQAMISSSGRVPEQGCRSPRLDFRGDGASLLFSWKITPSPNFLGLRASYRRRGAGRRWPLEDPQARPWVGPRLASLWWHGGPPPGTFRSLSSFRVKIDLRGFSALFENISLREFLKQKTCRNNNWLWASC